VYARLSEPAFAGVLVLMVAVALLRRRLDLGVSAALAGGGAALALAVAHVVSVLVDRPRPFAAHPDIHAFVHHAADASFPSDHATAAFAIAGVVALRHRGPGLALLVAAVVLAVSRVLLGLHYPADVLAGACIGLAGALVVCGAWSWASARQLDEKLGALPLFRRGQAYVTARRAGQPAREG
jgi:undecaprenyl-diphosphatase